MPLNFCFFLDSNHLNFQPKTTKKQDEKINDDLRINARYSWFR
jgi:hypothetical protein